MSNQVFSPWIRGLTWTFMRTPKLNTMVQTAANEFELRIRQTVNPIWTWTLIYDYLYNDPANIAPNLIYTDLQTLMGFYLARGGEFDSFLYTDPTDNFVGPALITSSPNPAAELSVVNDGNGHYYTPIQRPIGGLTSTWNDASRFFEDVTDLNGAITVYANGVLQAGGGADYSVLGPGLVLPGVSYLGLYLAWIAGAPTGPITVQFHYYYRVRFKTDSLDFEFFAQTIATMGDKGSRGQGYLELVTARPPTS